MTDSDKFHIGETVICSITVKDSAGVLQDAATSMTITITLGCILIAAIIGLDIYFAADTIQGNTWSEVIRRVGKTASIIPFVCGVLSGHFFWPAGLKEHIPLLGQPNSIALLVWMGCVVSMVGLVLTRLGHIFPMWIVFILGFLGGMLLWPVGRW